ncbi:hypothetical protein EVC26_064 [Rhizobium phage RHph_I72]|nr:hypothetical protein EVC13_062 [Rhizobium phage RHph_I65]QIG76510.1 hypothetical protein EVC26_064 [Rhizobium phage RHph_I72]
MMYLRTVAKAIIPRKLHDIVIVGCLTTLFVWAGFQIFLQSPPGVLVNAETQYPRSVPRGGFFYLNLDLTFDHDCTIKARRFIIARDGVEYLAQEDVKDVAANERIQYTVTVPVSESLPAGPALLKSQYAYECDFWSRWVRNITQADRIRRFEITEPVPQPTPSSFACELEPKPGFLVVRSYYRRDPRYIAQNR